jgi:M6 family metalloprotease-like protein
VRLPRPGSHYLPKEEYGWASFGRAHELVRDALARADRLVDFTGFDNDGPDGIPNSGDDDGFVDLVIILYAVPCQGEWREGSVWPHRGAIEPIQTGAKSANGGRIRVADYLILPVQEPGSCEPLQMGVLAHETGHALGLPDLYDYAGAAQGAGDWDLMGTGSHGALHSPAHLSAWSKEQLGWARVEWLKPGQDSLRIPPVQREGTIFRYDLPGPRGEYLLLENRQRLGSDSYLPGKGLLVWRVDPERAALGGWNGVGRYRGVELIRAGTDARTATVGTVGIASTNTIPVTSSGMSDSASIAAPNGPPSGDPFPGASRRDHLDLGSLNTVRLTGIREEWGGDIVADLSIGYTSPTLLARAPLRLAVLPGDTAHSRAIAVRREGGAADNWTPTTTAPWARVHRMGNLLIVTADPTGLAPGVYTDTVRFVLPRVDDGSGTALKSAGDAGDDTGGDTRRDYRADPAATTADVRQRTSEELAAEAAAGAELEASELPAISPAGAVPIQLEVADPGARSVIGTELPWGWGLAVESGRLYQASFGRDALSLRPRPRLLRLASQSNTPETLAQIQAEAVFAPVAGPHGSVYLLGRTADQNQIFRIDDDGSADLVASIPGAAPAYGAARLPDGRLLVADWSGRVSQVTPDGRVLPWIELGRNVYQITVGGEGAVYAAAHSGNLLRLDLTGRLTTISTGFGTGKLVTVTTAPDGAVFAAERGGLGRILRITPDGGSSEVARIAGAEFYGLAADHRFLYALDLNHRQLLRFPLATLGMPAVGREVSEGEEEFGG